MPLFLTFKYKNMKNLTKTIFATLSYPDFGNEKLVLSSGVGRSFNFIASTYFVDNNDIQDYNRMNDILKQLDIKYIIIISITKKYKGEQLL